MNRKIIRNSIISIVIGIIISAASQYIPNINEPVNYAGGMFILAGGIFIDQAVMKAIYGERKQSKTSLIRLLVYLLLAVLLLLLPQKILSNLVAISISKAFGIAFLLLALWRFFTFTTIEESKITDQKK